MELSKEQWTVVEPLIPKPPVRPDRRGRPWKPARLVLDAIVWVLRTGAPWRDIPERYPSYQTCHRPFQQWVQDGTFQRILNELGHQLDLGQTSESYIDGSYAKAKKGGNASAAVVQEKRPRSWRSPTTRACLSPSASQMATGMMSS